MNLVSSRSKDLTPKGSWLIVAGQVAAMSAVFFGLAVLAAEVRFGSLDAGRAYFAGARLLAESPEYMGNYDPRQSEVSLLFVIRNLGDDPVTIVGASASCACTVTESLPPSIPARGEAEIPARLKVESDRAGSILRGEIQVFTNHRLHPAILLSYVLKPTGVVVSGTTNHVSTGP